jgi:chemotaxis methyl-accepting protein methylase
VDVISSPVPRGARYRHVVFKSGTGRRVVNLAPGGARSLCAPHAPSASVFGPPLPRLTATERVYIDWLLGAAGLDPGTYREETLRRRLPACLRAVRADGVIEARRRLTADPSLVPAAVGTLLIGVTSFFRDEQVFADLARAVVPALRRGAGHPRVWSAGCSEGQELYSVAMLLDEAGLLRGATLLGTDCRSRAVAAAREGRYPQDGRALRDLPPARRRKYIEADQNDQQHRVCRALRGAIQWRSGDVTRVVEPGGWDLILCRHVAMYLRPEVAARLWLALEAALRPGGFLVLGKAERPVGPARLTCVAPCIYRRSGA